MSALSISTGDFLAAVGIATAPGTFGLVSSRSAEGPGATNTLGWTWPPNMLNAFGANITWAALTLQYSTTASNRPDPLVVYDVGNNLQPPFDVNWTTIKQWVTYAEYLADNADPNHGSFIHSWPTIQPVAYRLILNFGKGFDPAFPPFVEMTWNIRLIVPVQPLSASQVIVGGNPVTRLTWGAPDTSWWPGNFLQFLSYKRCACAGDACNPGGIPFNWNRITVNYTQTPTPLSYDVYKSTDGVTFGSPVITGVALNACNQWFDSGITTPGGTPWYYQFVAHLPDTTLVYSNIIFAN